MNFEDFVLDYLKSNRVFNIYFSSDFYEEACKNLGLDDNDLNALDSNSNKLRYRLRKMVKKNLISVRRVGTGYCGRTDFSHNHYNLYASKEYWGN